MPYTRSSYPFAVIKLIAMIVWIALLIGPAALARSLGWEKARRRIIRLYYQFMIFAMGLKLEVRGELSSDRPLLLVSNHASYVDVFVLGSLFPMSFTPKREVRRWPVIGWLCMIADCVFVERTPKAMKQAQEEMQQRLTDDKILVIFPEGTTNDGRKLKPFKSGFFELAAQTEPPLPVQSATIVYTHSNGHTIPNKEGACEHIAWVGDADFFSHFMGLLGLRSIHATLIVGDTKYLPDFESRKALCKACEEDIGKALHDALGQEG